MTGSPSIETQHGHPGIVLATLSLANVMALLDLFVVNVALHDIGVGLHYQSSLSDVAWVLNAYALFFGALLIPAGRFADKYGRKATFILGLAVFTVASLACAVSPDLWVLVGFRCVQAAGAAMIIPASLGLVLTTLPPDRVKRGVRVWAVSGAAAGSIGPVVGGLLTALSWRWIFVINLPIGIAAVLVTWKMIPNVRHDRTTRMPDLLGSLMIVVTIGAISLGLLNGPSWGWGSAKIIGSWAVAVAAAVAFVVSTRRAAVPVIDLKMFRSRVFSASNIAIVIAAAILGIQLLGLSLFLQQSWHWPAITTELALAPGPAAVLGASLIAPRLHQRFPIGAVVASGFALTAAGQALMISASAWASPSRPSSGQPPLTCRLSRAPPAARWSTAALSDEGDPCRTGPRVRRRQGIPSQSGRPVQCRQVLYKTHIGSIIGAGYRDGRLTGRSRRRPSRKVSTFSL